MGAEPAYRPDLEREGSAMGFRFGIQLLQAPLLLELSLPWLAQGRGEIRVDAAQVAERIAERGFRLVELNTDLQVFFPESFSLSDLQRLQELRRTQGLTYTVHLPLWSLDPSSPVEGIRRASVDRLVDAVLRLAPLEPEVYVLHVAGPLAAEFLTSPAIPEAARGALMRRFQQQAARSIEELLRRTGLPSRALAVETIQFPLELTLELAEALDLSLCFDTGHVISRQPGPFAFQEVLERCLPRLAEVHLHDGYYRQRPDGSIAWADHLPLGRGEVPARELLQTLEAHGFTGPIVLELMLTEAEESLAFLGGNVARE
ncbi:cobamide remodeling phosphodiesterase CbiR [Thermoflexus sp.]|uniref:cobamide remodeling phosphodiesterase CbiR n=1 Tax=Thermoflexus sp. TaxID=1969742 RepID=UPI0035E45B28